jgi:hypothetical protein
VVVIGQKTIHALVALHMSSRLFDILMTERPSCQKPKDGQNRLASG